MIAVIEIHYMHYENSIRKLIKICKKKKRQGDKEIGG
jgi:hypothetical protein